MVGYSTMYFCGLLYVIPALIMYLAYSSTTDPPLQDLYYKTFLDNPIFKFLNYFMNINFVYGMCSFTIYNMEMLEKIKAVQTFLRDSEGNLRSFNVFMCRIVFLISVLIMSVFLTDLRLVYAFNGIFLNSFIGLIIPGLLGVTRNSEYRKKDSPGAIFSDWLCVGSGIASFLIYFIDLFSGS